MAKKIKKQDNTDRHLELSSMFIQMGSKLMVEGKERNDYTISQLGTFMILLSSLVFDESDVQLFGQLCSMFSAKKILENMDKEKNPITERLKEKSHDGTYDDFIERINKFRKDNGKEPTA